MELTEESNTIKNPNLKYMYPHQLTSLNKMIELELKKDVNTNIGIYSDPPKSGKSIVYIALLNFFNNNKEILNKNIFQYFGYMGYGISTKIIPENYINITLIITNDKTKWEKHIKLHSTLKYEFLRYPNQKFDSNTNIVIVEPKNVKYIDKCYYWDRIIFTSCHLTNLSIKSRFLWITSINIYKELHYNYYLYKLLKINTNFESIIIKCNIKYYYNSIKYPTHKLTIKNTLDINHYFEELLLNCTKKDCEECPVCYETNYIPIQTSCCKKTFCISCIIKTNRTTDACPLCRSNYHSINDEYHGDKPLLHELYDIIKNNEKYIVYTNHIYIENELKNQKNIFLINQHNWNKNKIKFSVKNIIIIDHNINNDILHKFCYIGKLKPLNIYHIKI